jgi:ribosomal protein L37E
MSVHLSFKERCALCRRCRRPFAAHALVCPHCGHDRKPRFAVRRRNGENKLHGKSSRLSLRFMIAIVLAVMVVGGYMLVRESGLDARSKAISAHRTISHAAVLDTLHGMKTATGRGQTFSRGA